MKIRGIVTTTVLVLAIIAVSTTTAAALSCSDGDICVNQSGWWRDGGALNASTTPIQAAVSAATAGETIYVWNGSYTENVNIATAHLTLRGEGADAVTVTAADDGDHVFDVTGTWVNISGFTATGATSYPYAGIRISSVDHCNISDNNCSNNDCGIYLSSSSNNTLLGNTADSNDGPGICLVSSSNNTLLGNNVSSNNDCGISLVSSCNYNTLTGNTANSNSNCGIHLHFSSKHNTLTENTANSNTYYGIRLYNADNNNISCNWVHNNTDAGFYLTLGSTGNTIEKNNIIANGIYNDTSDGYEWQFKNYQSVDVSTAGNWWGTNNETRINASIYDWTYDAGWGNVTTNPRLDGPAPCAPIPELSTVLFLVVGLLMLVGYVRIGRKT